MFRLVILEVLMALVRRAISDTVLSLSDSFPVLFITGPRQSGKTTLAKMLFSDRPYITLETPSNGEFAREDPVGFLKQFPDGAILDEVQNAPELLSYIQGIVDEDGRQGLFILTGSQHFGMSHRISQSLAGRTAVIELLPFSYGELCKNSMNENSLESMLFKGAYPPIHDRGLDPRIWYRSYIRTYLERDVRTVLNVHDLGNFREFLGIVAGYTSQEVNYSKMGSACGIDTKTAKAWLSVLEESYVIRLLRPYHNNFLKRTTKTPKLYFHDTGLACYLRKIRDASQLSDPNLKGIMFENWVVSEMAKLRMNECEDDNLYFWRQQQGVEVDILLDEGQTLVPIEIKAGATPKVAFGDNLVRFMEWAKGKAKEPCVIYAGDETRVMKGVAYFPWHEYFNNSSQQGIQHGVGRGSCT